MSRLDFLIVGNPRSGTTFVDGFLRRHPDVFMAFKELHYFGSDLGFDEPRRSLLSYEQQLAGARPGQLVGESSVWYLHSARAAAEAAAYQPNLKIVANLRAPVPWLHSVHAMLAYYCDEPILDFAAALAAVDRRRQAVPARTRPPVALRYDELVRYVDRLQPWVDAFGRDRLHVVLFDELRRDPAAELRRLLRFLGVAEDFDGFERALEGTKTTRNANKMPRSWTVQRAITSPWARRVVRQHERGFPGARLGLRALRRLNGRDVPRAPLDPALAADLAERFRPEVERLEAFLGRELPGWKVP